MTRKGPRGIGRGALSLSKKASAFFDKGDSLRSAPRSSAWADDSTLAPREVFFRRTRRRKNDLIFFRRLRAAELCEAFLRC